MRYPKSVQSAAKEGRKEGAEYKSREPAEAATLPSFPIEKFALFSPFTLLSSQAASQLSSEGDEEKSPTWTKQKKLA